MTEPSDPHPGRPPSRRPIRRPMPATTAPGVRSPMPGAVSTTGTPAVTDDLFHAVALAAFVAVAGETGEWPDAARVKRVAYRWYEEELRRANADKESRAPPPPAR